MCTCKHMRYHARVQVYVYSCACMPVCRSVACVNACLHGSGCLCGVGLSMYVCVCILPCVHACVFVNVCEHVYYVCLCVYMRTSASVCVSACVSACVSGCVCVFSTLY